MDITNQWFHYLHTTRKLSPRVISLAKLDVYEDRLKIPVYDEEGNYKFSKFRKAPWDDYDEPKYKYEYGASISLYGAQVLNTSDDVVICEGELDCLTLLSSGYHACTSTGGAMSFQESWVPLFAKKNITLMFDNDDTGIKGAVRAAFMLRNITYRWVPPRFGKDVSDVLMNYDEEMLKLLMRQEDNAVKIHIPQFGTKKQMKEYRAELLTEVKKMSSGSIGTLFLRAIIVELSTRIAERKKREAVPFDGTDRERANAFPIDNLIKVNRQGFALCPFHNEKSPSLKVYKDNHAYCFGLCGKRYDAIAIAMEVWGVDFKSALEKLIK